jgi:hypothetical protein
MQCATRAQRIGVAVQDIQGLFERDGHGGRIAGAVSILAKAGCST